MSQRRVAQQINCIASGFNGNSNLDITVSNPVGLDFGASSDFSVAFWMNTAQRSAGRVAVGRRAGTTAADVGWLIGSSAGGGLFVELSDGVTEASSTTSVGPAVNNSSWHLCGVTFDRDGLAQIYVDGVAGNSFSIASVGDISTSATANFRVGRDGSGNNRFQGEIGPLRIWNTLLTSTEIAQLYGSFIVPKTSNLVTEWTFNSIAGTTLYDTSGQGNHGTISSGVVLLKQSTPSRKRKAVGGSLVFNGDFEINPVLVAGTTPASRWIDGTASGSTAARSVFGWSIPSAGVGVSASASFDTTVYRSGSCSMKLDVADTSGSISVGQSLNAGTSAATDDLFILEPSTSYTLTGYIKTINVPTNGAFIDVREHSGSYANVATNSTNKLSGTNDWTRVTVTFTTNATTRFGQVLLRNNVTGNVCTAWFDDIVLTKTTPEARTASGNRLLVRDFGTALSFDAAAASNQVVVPHISAYTFNEVVSCSFWAQSKGVQVDAEILSKNVGGRYPFTFRYNNSNGRIQFAAFDGTFNPGTVGTRYLLRGDGWVHFAGVRDGQTLKFYRNGALQETITDTTTGSTDNSSDIAIGNRTASTKWFGGMIDDVLITNTALSSDAVSALYYRGMKPSTGIVLDLGFNEGSGSTAVDGSEFSNNATITGATYISNVRMIPRTLVS